MTQLALVIDLNVCVGCHACVTSCKQWNTSGWAGPMSDHKEPPCVSVCPTSARLLGDAHDPDSEVSVAIRERGGYQLMPEWGTRPANHYLPRRKTRIHIDEDELTRANNPLCKEDLTTYTGEEALDDVAW